MLHDDTYFGDCFTVNTKCGMKSKVLLFVLASSLAGVTSFSGLLPRHGRSTRSSVALAAAGKRKGFGAAPEAPKKKKPVEPATTSESTSNPVVTTASTSASSSSSSSPNAGQAALAEMRRQRAEAKDAELRKVREMLQADKQVEQAPAAIPEKVAQRMGQRMLPFVGLPLLGGMGCFVAFWYLATYKDMEFQPVLVAGSTILILVFSLLVRGSDARKCGVFGG